MKLLDKAKSYAIKKVLKHEPTADEIELAVAWANGKVTGRQVAFAIGVKTGSETYWLTRSLAAAVRQTE